MGAGRRCRSGRPDIPGGLGGQRSPGGSYRRKVDAVDPREASRISLRVVTCSVERVQDITGYGALAEGIEPPAWVSHPQVAREARERFAALWDDIYGTWEQNPFVWACEFEVIR